MKVRVYRNLNKGGLSIQVKTEKGWRVRDYSLFVVLKNCTFKVLKSGRERVLREKCKNVHAWVEGELVSKEEKDYLKCGFPEPWYDPYKTDHFQVEGKALDFCDNLRAFSPPKTVTSAKGKKKTKRDVISKKINSNDSSVKRNLNQRSAA